MKYTWAIIASTGLFAVIGLLAGWGLAQYAPASQDAPAGRADRMVISFIGFIALPLGGAVAGLVVGCIASALGRRFGEKRDPRNGNRSPAEPAAPADRPRD